MRAPTPEKGARDEPEETLSTCPIREAGLRGLYHAKPKKRGAEAPQEDAWRTLHRPCSVGLTTQERRNLQVVVIARWLCAFGDVEVHRRLRDRLRPRLGCQRQDV